MSCVLSHGSDTDWLKTGSMRSNQGQIFIWGFSRPFHPFISILSPFPFILSFPAVMASQIQRSDLESNVSSRQCGRTLQLKLKAS